MKTIHIASWVTARTEKIPAIVRASLIPGRRILRGMREFGCRISRCARNAWQWLAETHRNACQATCRVLRRCFFWRTFPSVRFILKPLTTIFETGENTLLEEISEQLQAATLQIDHCKQSLLKLTRLCAETNPHLAHAPVQTMPTLLGQTAQAPYWRMFLPYLLAFYHEEVVEEASPYVQSAGVGFQTSRSISDQEVEVKTHTLLIFSQAKSIYEKMMSTRKRALPKDGFQRELLKAFRSSSTKLKELEEQAKTSAYAELASIQEAIQIEERALANNASFLANLFFIMKAHLSTSTLTILSP